MMVIISAKSWTLGTKFNNKLPFTEQIRLSSTLSTFHVLLHRILTPASRNVGIVAVSVL